MNELILYDIPGRTAETKAWSPNTWRTRFSLNFKGLKYRTEWVEYPDIESVCKKIGAGPTSTAANGSPEYTLPVLYDPSTDSVVVDSTVIADYLDNAYPDTPRLFPAGTRGLNAAFQSALGSALGRRDALYSLIVLSCCLNLNERGHEYFRRTREVEQGRKLEEVAPEGEVREQMWHDLEVDLSKIARWYHVGEEGPFIMGEAPCWADFILASRLLWAKHTLGKDSKDWRRFASIDGGRWPQFLQHFDPYTQVV